MKLGISHPFPALIADDDALRPRGVRAEEDDVARLDDVHDVVQGEVAVDDDVGVHDELRLQEPRDRDDKVVAPRGGNKRCQAPSSVSFGSIWLTFGRAIIARGDPQACHAFLSGLASSTLTSK